MKDYEKVHGLTDEEIEKCLGLVKVSGEAYVCFGYILDYKLANWRRKKNKFLKKDLYSLKKMKRK